MGHPLNLLVGRAFRRQNQYFRRHPERRYNPPVDNTPHARVRQGIKADRSASANHGGIQAEYAHPNRNPGYPVSIRIGRSKSSRPFDSIRVPYRASFALLINIGITNKCNKTGAGVNFFQVFLPAGASMTCLFSGQDACFAEPCAEKQA